MRRIGKAQIQYFGSIRAAAGLPGEEVDIPSHIGLFALLEELAGAHGAGFRGEVFAGETLREDLTAALNGTIIKHEAAEEAQLRPGDVLALFPLFPGGG